MSASRRMDASRDRRRMGTDRKAGRPDTAPAPPLLPIPFSSSLLASITDLPFFRTRPVCHLQPPRHIIYIARVATKC